MGYYYPHITDEKAETKSPKHTGSKRWNQELNTGRPTSEAVFLAIAVQSLSNKKAVFPTDSRYFK